MSIFDHKLDHSKLKKCRVELHLHLTGSVRLTTIQELAIQKNFKVTANNTLEEIQNEIPVKLEDAKDLLYFISKIARYAPLFVGDAETIERIAYELAEDQAKENVIYFEVRYPPHTLSNTVKHVYCEQPFPESHPSALSPRDVIKAVTKGLSRASNDFGIHARQILNMIKQGNPNFCGEVVELAKEFSPDVVGIDIAGDETCGYTPAEIAAYHKAQEYGIHRTAHAAESGPAANVQKAINELGAERIGHGYHVVDDPEIYKWAREKNVHFECCPCSSLLTGSVNPCADRKHPIVQFAEDGVNFSLSKDDTTITQSTLDTEYDLLRRLGFEETQLFQANMNAAKSSFLPEKERDSLVSYILSVVSNISEENFNNIFRQN